MQSGSFKSHLMKKEATARNANGLVQKTSDKKEATLKNEKGLLQKTSDEKKRQPQKTPRDSFRRPPMNKEATQKM
jgi:hypothetical protein